VQDNPTTGALAASEPSDIVLPTAPCFLVARATLDSPGGPQFPIRNASETSMRCYESSNMHAVHRPAQTKHLSCPSRCQLGSLGATCIRFESIGERNVRIAKGLVLQPAFLGPRAKLRDLLPHQSRRSTCLQVEARAQEEAAGVKIDVA